MVVKRRKPIKLKLKRIELGIRACDLALELKISPATLSLIENGLQVPEWHIKEAAAEKLEVPFDELWV